MSETYYAKWINTCYSCFYFLNVLNDDDICRWRPPGIDGQWPIVNANDWCGQYSQRPDFLGESELHGDKFSAPPVPPETEDVDEM